MRSEEVNEVQLPIPLAKFATVHLYTGVYFICGANQSFVLNTLKNTVKKTADPRHPRESFCLALSPCKRFVFAIGGVNLHDQALISSVDRYTIATDSWETVA